MTTDKIQIQSHTVKLTRKTKTKHTNEKRILILNENEHTIYEINGFKKRGLRAQFSCTQRLHKIKIILRKFAP